MDESRDSMAQVVLKTAIIIAKAEMIHEIRQEERREKGCLMLEEETRKKVKMDILVLAMVVR